MIEDRHSSTVTLSIGSNSADKEEQMQSAIEWLKTILENVRVSSIYSTPSINGCGDDYLNAVVTGLFVGDYESLNCIAKEYEKRCGRSSESKLKSSIPIDIDVVIFDDAVMRTKDFSFDFFQIGYKEIQR